MNILAFVVAMLLQAPTSVQPSRVDSGRIVVDVTGRALFPDSVPAAPIPVRLIAHDASGAVIWDSSATSTAAGRFAFRYGGPPPTSVELQAGRARLLAGPVIPWTGGLAVLGRWRLHMWTDTTPRKFVLPRSGATNVDLVVRSDPSGAGYTILLLWPAIVCIFFAIKTIRDFRLVKSGRSLVTSATAAAISWTLVILYLAYATASQDLETLAFFSASVQFPVVVLVAAFIGVLVYAAYVLTHEDFASFFRQESLDDKSHDVPKDARQDAPRAPATDTITAVATARAAAPAGRKTVANRVKDIWGRAMVKVTVPHVVRDPYRNTREQVLLDLGNHITIAPYVALMAVLVLGEGVSQSPRVTVFLAFFTGLWIKPVLAALSTFGMKLLPSDRVGTDGKPAAEVGAAAGAAAGAVAAAAAGGGHPVVSSTSVRTTSVGSTSGTTPAGAAAPTSNGTNPAHETGAVVEALKSLSR